ncbi:MAG: glucosaminidase domain-containing protein [Hyphomicrobiaceae bacterium]
MPAIKTSSSNRVPECATPGRLTDFLKSGNASLDPRFSKIAIDYMRQGEKLGLRWDYTFFQMILETGYLTYRGDNGRPGDVKPSQNNFAGIGATGGGNPGESFSDVDTGVLAHMQHVLLYSGATIDNPVAERTRKVQEWGVLNKLKKQSHRHPITFAQLAKIWAPRSNYVSGLETLADKFYSGYCKERDPHPEWVAEARGIATRKTASAGNPNGNRPSRGDELARRAIEEGKAQDDNTLSGLGAAGLGSVVTPSYSILNSPSDSADEGPDKPAASANAGHPARFLTASAASNLAASITPPPTPKPHGCHVWTASYGGLKALIIRVKAPRSTEYTVLEVNEANARREAEAYIAAYAKGGEIAGEFQNQSQALDKAFKLCPEK